MIRLLAIPSGDIRTGKDVQGKGGGSVSYRSLPQHDDFYLLLMGAELFVRFFSSSIGTIQSHMKKQQ